MEGKPLLFALYLTATFPPICPIYDETVFTIGFF